MWCSRCCLAMYGSSPDGYSMAVWGRKYQDVEVMLEKRARVRAKSAEARVYGVWAFCICTGLLGVRVDRQIGITWLGRVPSARDHHTCLFRPKRQQLPGTKQHRIGGPISPPSSYVHPGPRSPGFGPLRLVDVGQRGPNTYLLGPNSPVFSHNILNVSPPDASSNLQLSPVTFPPPPVG